MTEHPELWLHIQIAQVLKNQAGSDWLWCHVPNGEARDASHASKLKAMGVRPGWPDFTLISFPHGQVRFIEVKRPGGTLSEAQEELKTTCRRFAISFAVVETIQEALTTLRWWNVIPPAENQQENENEPAS